MRRALTSLAAIALGALALAPAVALAAPASIVSIYPSPVTAPGGATVRFKITGASVTSTVSVVVRGTEFAGSSVSQETESLAIRGVKLHGPGMLMPALPPLTGFPPSCERGGFHPSSSVSAWTLALPANASTNLIVTATIPEGFASQTPGVDLETGPLVPAGQTAPVDAKDDHVIAQIPRVGTTIDALELKVAAGSRAGTFVATGRLYPQRVGALVRLIGVHAKPANSVGDRIVANQKLGIFKDAMRPLDRKLTAYGKGRTTDGGAFSIPFKAPDGTVVVARSRGVGGGTDPGASCPVQAHG